MVIQVADHPEIISAELEISLPEAVAVFSLKALRSPSFPRLGYWMIQTGLADSMVRLVVVYGETLVVEVTGYLVWSPVIPLTQLNNHLLEGTIKN